MIVLVSLEGSEPLAFAAWLVIALDAFAAGRWTGRAVSVAGLAVLTGTLLAAMGLTAGAPVPALIVPTTAWVAGRALRGRELVAARLAERARELDAEREAYTQLSVRYERARIASELHDIVAHALSVMVVQASAGQRIAAVDPELTAEAFEAIAGSARHAEEDMARLVALLGDPEAAGAAPDLPLVGELVARAKGSGLDVSLRLEGDRESLPPAVAETAYRVVQESLTNALRHASGSTVEVLVRGDATELLVEIVSGPTRAETPLAGVGTGNGLRGLRERATACGGSLAAGPLAGGGWRVAARLPRRPALAPARSPPPRRRGGAAEQAIEVQTPRKEQHAHQDDPHRRRHRAGASGAARGHGRRGTGHRPRELRRVRRQRGDARDDARRRLRRDRVVRRELRGQRVPGARGAARAGRAVRAALS